MDASLELINAVFDRLRATASVTSLVQQFYDEPPADQTPSQRLQYPYVSNGPTSIIPDDFDCIDGEEITIQIDVWSHSASSEECRKICSAIKRALHNVDDLTLTENALVTLQHELTRILDDRNPSIRHGVIQFTATIETP